MTMGLEMNKNKTKCLVENIGNQEGTVSVSSKSLELVEYFLYLGAKIRSIEEDAL